MTHTLAAALFAQLAPRLRCPGCGGGLLRTGTAFNCDGCGTAYPDTATGQLDLRPRRKTSVSLSFELGGQEEEIGDQWPALRARERPEVDFSDTAVPYHLSRELLSWFPRAAAGSLALDLGCGTTLHRGVCEQAGFGYVGVDYRGASAPLLADGHCLPFTDASFDFVIAIAVLEHVRFPFLFLHEVARVLRPGGTFIGTVAFLEPYHASYYHHSHLGLLNGLRFARLEVVAFGPVKSWPALRALAEMALFPPLPGAVTRVLVSPLQGLHRLWWRLAGVLRAGATDARRRAWTAGAFEFVARGLERPCQDGSGGRPSSRTPS